MKTITNIKHALWKKFLLSILVSILFVCISLILFQCQIIYAHAFSNETISELNETEIDDEEFTFDDFGGEYVESIHYNAWYSTLDPESGWITVQLKDEYKDKLDEVMQKVSEKDFVEYVEKIGYIYQWPFI